MTNPVRMLTLCLYHTRCIALNRNVGRASLDSERVRGTSCPVTVETWKGSNATATKLQVSTIGIYYIV